MDQNIHQVNDITERYNSIRSVYNMFLREKITDLDLSIDCKYLENGVNILKEFFPVIVDKNETSYKINVFEFMLPLIKKKLESHSIMDRSFGLTLNNSHGFKKSINLPNSITDDIHLFLTNLKTQNNINIENRSMIEIIITSIFAKGDTTNTIDLKLNMRIIFKLIIFILLVEMTKTKIKTKTTSESFKNILRIVYQNHKDVETNEDTISFQLRYILLIIIELYRSIRERNDFLSIIDNKVKSVINYQIELDPSNQVIDYVSIVHSNIELVLKNIHNLNVDSNNLKFPLVNLLILLIAMKTPTTH